MGSLLFDIYVNDFPRTTNQLCQGIMLANDTSVLTTITDDDLNHIYNSVLLHISKWFQVNQFILNANKTHAVQFMPHKVFCYPLNLTFNKFNIFLLKPTLKCLGLQLDSHLTWKTRINSLLHKLSTICFIMRRLFRILNVDTLRIVYFVNFYMLIKYSVIFCY